MATTTREFVYARNRLVPNAAAGDNAIMASDAESESMGNGQQRQRDERHDPGCTAEHVNGHEKTGGAAEPALPVPLQEHDGWTIPAALRETAIGELSRIIRSRRAKPEIKIRAIETLVRIDGQSLAETRQHDWRDVQSSNSSRSNVRILAELARQRSLPAQPPRSSKGEPKP